MVLLSLPSALVAGLFLASTTLATDPQLVGTWTTKSASVFTGPGFYNPINDSFIEPSLTGISYSFTADGFYEEAYYRAISNPTVPQCPQAVLQFQHGTFTNNPDGSLTLTPFGVDGRELLSNPCASQSSLYKRFTQVETMKQYQILTDKYKNVQRLNLYGFDGAPFPPMYLAYRPPLMLPTVTMNPTTTAAAATAAATTKVTKRSFIDGMELPLNKHAKHIKRTTDTTTSTFDANLIWWAGVGMTILGGAAYLL